MRKRIRVSASSLPVLKHIHNYVVSWDLRGDLLPHAASDSCDGLFLRSELDDLIRRRLLAVVKHGFDDSRGPDPMRAGDEKLCGVGWTVHATDKLVRSLWPDRSAA